MMKDLPVRLIVESQVLLQKYKEARGEMHFLYKIVRADSDVTLYKQFAVGTSAILKQKNKDKKKNKDQNWKNAEQEALNKLDHTLKMSPNIIQSEEELCSLLRNASVNGWKVCVDKVISLSSDIKLDAKHGKVQRDWDGIKSTVLQTHTMVYPTVGFIGMPNGGVCFRCECIRAKTVCKLCHLCSTCCAEELCVPCQAKCRWCDGGSKKKALEIFLLYDKKKIATVLKKIEAMDKDPVKNGMLDYTTFCEILKVDPAPKVKKLFEAEWKDTITGKTKYLFLKPCLHPCEKSCIRNPKCTPGKGIAPFWEDKDKKNKITDGHDHRCCKPGRFQFCYVKGKYPKWLSTYEYVAARVNMEKKQTGKVDQACAAVIVKRLRAGADVNEKDEINANENKKNWTGLMHLASKGRTISIQAILTHSLDWIDINASGRSLCGTRNNTTALMLASSQGFVETVTCLLSAKNINVEAKDSDGKDALHYATKAGYKEIVDILKAIIKDPSFFDVVDNNEMESLKKKNRKTEVEYNEKKVKVWNPKEKKNNGFNPKQSILDVVKNMKDELIIQADMLWDDVNKNGIKKKEQHIMTSYSKTSCGHKTKSHCKTCFVCEKCAPNTSLCLSKRGVEDNSKTALFLACEEDRPDVVESLLRSSDSMSLTTGDNRIDVNATDQEGRTPLSIASVNGYEECVKMLLQHPLINVNKGDRADGMTSLMLATTFGHEGTNDQQLFVMNE